MNELDIKLTKEKYVQYKFEHYDDEREMRKLLKIRKLIPSMSNDAKWKKDYKMLNEKLADGLYYYNELKNILSENEFKNFMDKVKYDILKEKCIKYKLDKVDDDFFIKLEDDDRVFANELNNEQKIIPKIEQFDKSMFAKTILDEIELMKKIEIIRRYQKSTLDVFFDTTSILKAELVRLFIKNKNIENIDKNRIITACLVYTFKRTHSPKEIERIKKEKENDKQFLQSLGFDEYFCKICSEYNRYNETEDYKRENEGDILELIDKFVGLIMHREDRLAFPVNEALDVLDNKLLNGVENKYQVEFFQFVEYLEQIEAKKNVGIMTYIAQTVNKIKRNDIIGIYKMIKEIRNLLGENVDEYKIMRLEKVEKLQDKYTILQNLQNTISQLKDRIGSMSKILRNYRMLSDEIDDTDIIDEVD